MSLRFWMAASVFCSCVVSDRFFLDKYDLTQHPNYKYTSDFDKRNEFNIEQFLSRRLKLKAGDEFVVVDAIKEVSVWKI